MYKYNTEQEVFDAAVRGLASQDFKQSVSLEGESCQYRGTDGLKCAIGHLIPDELYLSSIENSGVDHILGKYECIKELFNMENIRKRFLRVLQASHDSGDTPYRMVDLFRELARQYQLSTSVLDEVTK